MSPIAGTPEKTQVHSSACDELARRVNMGGKARPQERFEDLDAKELKEQLDKVVALWTHPEMIKVLQTVAQAPAKDREELVRRMANVPALKRRGVPVPEGLKVTTRYFFEDEGGVYTGSFESSDGKLPKFLAAQKNIRLAGCCCGGGATFCGGCGG